MAEKENKQKHKSTIDKYFSRTADGYKVWVEEDEEGRNYMQVAAETTGYTDENGNKGFNFHISYHFKTEIIAKGLSQVMERDENIRQIIIEAAEIYYIKNIKIKE